MVTSKKFLSKKGTDDNVRFKRKNTNFGALLLGIVSYGLLVGELIYGSTLFPTFGRKGPSFFSIEVFGRPPS